jgi:V/A-type H+-transporting ATPase subunit A
MIIKVSGPLVVAKMENAKMGDLVKVGSQKLIGEVIELRSGQASVQVYEETAGLKVGDPIESTGAPLSVELGPGLITSIFDGIERPLNTIYEKAGDFIPRGIDVPALPRDKKWKFEPTAEKGAQVAPGDILGFVQETPILKHYIMVPPDVSGKVEEIHAGEKKITDTIAVVSGKKVTMLQKWPVRKRRELAEKFAAKEPLVTGQRVIDTLFPIAKGGAACVPGPFGAGKTVIQHQLAKWADADVIIFVGCGERGNEMTDVLLEFPHLKDPKSGRPLLERTVLIANTSNMPIAAREASVYTGATIAEYFRDMGYNVALMADSTSRWAEALREMSGRLEEMPGEEGYPAYLSSRLADFYERSGTGQCFGRPEREGSLTIIGSVSPPGGDFSEPVVQNTLRTTKVFWGLDYSLAHKRHFPAINWLLSYSMYQINLAEFFRRNLGPDFEKLKEETLRLLTLEAELEEIVRLVGVESLSENEQLILFTSKIIREDFLYQSAFDPVDQYSSLKKQYLMLKLILNFNREALKAIVDGHSLEKIRKEVAAVAHIARLRFVEENRIESEIKSLGSDIEGQFNNLRGRIEHAKS